MKVIYHFGTFGLVLLLASCASRPAYQDAGGKRVDDVSSYPYAQAVAGAPETPPSPAAWPKVFARNGTTNIIYQLQVDAWDGSALTGRNAVAVQTPDQPTPVYGVLTVRATTMVDRSQRTVSLLNLQLVSADFPSAPAKAEEFLGMLRQNYPAQVQVLSLDTLEAALAANAERVKTAGQALNNEPPKIIFSEKPAVLVSVDGDPAFRPVETTHLQRIINTRYLLLKDAAGNLHLQAGKIWLQSGALDGPWVPGSAPAGWETAQKQARDAGQIDDAEEADRAANTPSSREGGQLPAVYVSTKPAELIVFAGAPNYVPIPGTQLLYVTNTTGNVFKALADQKNYVLLSGRWFRSKSFEGPWEYVSGGKLPPDFARIPDDSPKENVKASVPGTPQAQEALIANTIPQTTAVQRSSELQDLQIDGAPQLAAIGGTPLQYVVNSGTPIIRVDAKSWYACQNGVWYAATSVDGPWLVADSVPAVIYSIPASSPMHYVTYVRVYDSNESVVYQGYTPGYLGTVVDSDEVVVYGTGYYYRPWIGSVWYAPPMTWGLGCGPYWAPWSGWSFGFGFGWYGGLYPYNYYYYPYWAWCEPYPWWGPYRYYAHHVHGLVPAHGPQGWANTSANMYQRSTRVQAVRQTSGNRPAPVQAAQVYGRAYNSRTGALVAGERGEVQNVFRTPPFGGARSRTAVPASTDSSMRGGVYSARPERNSSGNRNQVPAATRSERTERSSAIPDYDSGGRSRESSASSGRTERAPAASPPPPAASRGSASPDRSSSQRSRQ